MMIIQTAKACYRLLEQAPLQAGEFHSLVFLYSPLRSRPAQARLWLFLDIRQAAGMPQTDNPSAPNYLAAETSNGRPVPCRAYLARTLDLYPRLPEFLYSCEFQFDSGLAAGEEVTIRLGSQAAGWQAPKHPIQKFHFWFLESEPEGLEFRPTGYKTYHTFTSDVPETLQERISGVSLPVLGEWPQPDLTNRRPTPGILWGDLHGMAFNQRPLDDYYHYAKEIAGLEFAAAMLFGYNICVAGVWQAVKDAARHWTRPGCFIAIAGVESGTLPDGSHRNAYFFKPDHVPPIFCEDRPPARDPRLVRRFSPDTVFCDDLESFYAAVARYGGIVTGHFHTWSYQREILAEIWQKQVSQAGDEAHIFKLLDSGLRLGIVAGSDTHDSLPGNPAPEPYCPQPAGLMAVLSNEISIEAIHAAILSRRVYGTTGARITLHFSAGAKPMGSVLPAAFPRQFTIGVEGTISLAMVELIRDGVAIRQYQPDQDTFQILWEDGQAEPDRAHWYVLKVTQEDGHRAWSSPIWFENG